MRSSPSGVAPPGLHALCRPTGFPALGADRTVHT